MFCVLGRHLSVLYMLYSQLLNTCLQADSLTRILLKELGLDPQIEERLECDLMCLHCSVVVTAIDDL